MPQVDCSDIHRKVKVCLSIPRVCWTANMMCAYRVALELGLKVEYHSSAFWSRSLEYCLRHTMEDPASFEYALTIDYDSTFTKENVLYLYALMKANPEQDAIAALQLKRGTGELMTGLRDAQGNLEKQVTSERLVKELEKVSYAHFGLTLIRMSALRSIPLPWFLRMPDPEKPGESIDDDMYFWANFERHGKILSVAAHNPVGHLQEMVAIPGQNLSTIYQPWDDFEQNGPRGEVRQCGGRIAKEIPIPDEMSDFSSFGANGDSVKTVDETTGKTAEPPFQISDGSPMPSLGGAISKADDKADAINWGRLPEDRKRSLAV